MHKFQRSDDQELIVKLRARDKDAFAALVRELHGSLLRVAMMFVSSRATAEEIAQDTWGNVLASLDPRPPAACLRLPGRGVPQASFTAVRHGPSPP